MVSITQASLRVRESHNKAWTVKASVFRRWLLSGLRPGTNHPFDGGHDFCYKRTRYWFNLKNKPLCDTLKGIKDERRNKKMSEQLIYTGKAKIFIVQEHWTWQVSLRRPSHYAEWGLQRNHWGKRCWIIRFRLLFFGKLNAVAKRRTKRTKTRCA